MAAATAAMGLAAMAKTMEPARYEAWYYTPRGSWIGERESTLLLALMRPLAGQTLLDVGCGTGYFSRRFAAAGLSVTGIDPDRAMIGYARTQGSDVDYVEGKAERLPFDDERFDYTAAVTSLCFVADPASALAEMWRVSRNGVVLGLLNRHSLLYMQKHGKGAYAGARWDTWQVVRRWIAHLVPPAAEHRHRTAIIFPQARMMSRLVEPLFSGSLQWGGFLAVYIDKRG